MSATTDLIMERRRVRRKLTFWRVVAVVAVVALVAVLLPLPGSPGSGPHVARIWIDGTILHDPRRERAIDKLAEDDDVQALIVRINSPGGTVVASEALYDGLRRVAEKKPVVAVMSEVAASGGYVAALAAERIYARGNTLTGSIGVYADIPNIAGLLDRFGIEVTKVKSAPLKGEPSLTTEPAPGAIEAQDRLVEDTFAWFKGLVQERRPLEPAELDNVADGRAFTGRQALERKLIDALGDEEDALEWLEKQHGIDAGDGPRTRSWDDSGLPFPFPGMEESMAWLGLDQPSIPRGPRLWALIQ